VTNAVAVIGLTYDGTDVQQSGFGIFLEIVRGLNETPEVRGTDTVVPGRAGRIARNRVADRLPIELRGIVMGNGANEAAQRADFRTNVLALRALFSSSRVPANLVATLEDGSTATISARPLPGMLWDEQVASLFANVSVELESVDPEWVIT
jgi:hypothetical protein